MIAEAATLAAEVRSARLADQLREGWAALEPWQDSTVVRDARQRLQALGLGRCLRPQQLRLTSLGIEVRSADPIRQNVMTTAMLASLSITLIVVAFVLFGYGGGAGKNLICTLILVWAVAYPSPNATIGINVVTYPWTQLHNVSIHLVGWRRSRTLVVLPVGAHQWIALVDLGGHAIPVAAVVDAIARYSVSGTAQPHGAPGGVRS
ncbi:MAG: hypothetical protein HKP61_16435 [Dactylosporangium sp.]|nr:hypothetical protein [Dactylosporangium sp.]NNJ62495.1 hypothetical protein [Dactylosporangium sp.]